MKIEMGKKYRTRSGVEVRILAVDLDDGEYTVAGFIKGNGLYTYTSDGKFYIPHSSNPEDLVEVSKWEDFAIDDKVMVRNIGRDWHRQHFSGVSGKGKPTAFSNAATSWSNVTKPVEWDECRRPTEEELR